MPDPDLETVGTGELLDEIDRRCVRCLIVVEVADRNVGEPPTLAYVLPNSHVDTLGLLDYVRIRIIEEMLSGKQCDADGEHPLLGN